MMRLGAEGEAYFIEQVSDLGDSDSEADGGSLYAQSERDSVQIEPPATTPSQMPKDAISALQAAPSGSRSQAGRSEHEVGNHDSSEEPLDEEQKDFLQIQMQVKKSYKRKKAKKEGQEENASDATSNLSQSQVPVEIVDEEPEPINPELYRASSSALMKYAEEELINQEELSRMLEKKRSQIVTTKRPLLLNEESKGDED